MATKKPDIRNNPGNALKQRRCDLGYSIEDAAQASGIPQRHIHLLETEQLDRLPSFLYVKAFLDRYCTFLRMPCDIVTASYKRKYAVIVSESKRPQKHQQLRVKDSKITPRRLSVVASSVLFLGLGAYSLWQSSFLFQAPELTIESPVSDIVTVEDQITVIGATDSQATLTLNGEQIFVESNGVFAETVLLNEGVNTLTIIAANRFGKENTRVIRATYQP